MKFECFLEQIYDEIIDDSKVYECKNINYVFGRLAERWNDFTYDERNELATDIAGIRYKNMFECIIDENK